MTPIKVFLKITPLFSDLGTKPFWLGCSSTFRRTPMPPALSSPPLELPQCFSKTNLPTGLLASPPAFLMFIHTFKEQVWAMNTCRGTLVGTRYLKMKKTWCLYLNSKSTQRDRHINHEQCAKFCSRSVCFIHKKCYSYSGEINTS